MPLVAIVFMLLSFRLEPHEWATAGARALLGLGTVLGCWALGRELAPDEQAAAFVGMALGLGTAIVAPEARLLPVFVALALARMVNRTVGPPATPPDDAAVVVLVAVTAFMLRWPDLWLVAALAFWVDAREAPHFVRHRAVAALCVFLGAAQMVLGRRLEAGFALPSEIAHPPVLLTALVVTGGFLALIISTRRLSSTTDRTSELLSARRVRAGRVVVLALAVLGLVAGAAPIERSALLWATITGVTLAAGPKRLGGRVGSLTSPS